MPKIFFSATIAWLALGAAAFAQDSRDGFSLPHVTAWGSAEEEVKPDIAVLTLGVVNEQPTPKEAISENAKLAAELVADIKGQGIDAKDIKTETLELSKLEIVERDPKTFLEIKRTMKGYRASELFRIRIRNVDKAGAIVGHMVEHGANTYRSLSFALTDNDARIDALRARAVADARRKAALYAQGASAKLGSILVIDANPTADGQADLPSRRSVPVPEQSTPIPVEPGLLNLSASVQATWELVQE